MNLRSSAFATKLLFSFFTLLVFVSLYLFQTSKTLAAENPFPSGEIDCGDQSDPNFHSLRPYQANPCKEGVADEALFCGNDLLLKDTRLAYKNQAIKCEGVGDNKERCYFNTGKVTKNIVVDLSGAELPILGNTELVKNSQNQEEELDDAQKVNDYVAWYLNGVINRAEYPFVGTRTEEDIRKVVDFSGPLNKLLPQEIQWISRSKTVKNAVAGDEQHNQIAGCTYGLNLLVTQLFGVPAPCYNAGLLTGLIEARHFVSEWNGHLPPLREDFETFERYWRAVQNWRGKFCPLVQVPERIEIPFTDIGFDIPFIGGQEVLLLCGLENPLSPNYFANLFSYIPYSSTEDREGSVEARTVSPQQTGDVVVSDVSFSNQDPAELFFAHMEGVVGLADLLQSTFASKDQERVGGASSSSTGTSCDIAQIRTNAGDNLFAGEIQGDLSYVAEFSCDFEIPEIEPGGTCFAPADCPEDQSCNLTAHRCIPNSNISNPSCTKNIFVNLSLITKTPLADELYSRLVDGPASVFKRLFPKIGGNGPLEALLDIPAATKVNYSGDAVVQAGNPGNERSGESAELYFPHLGSVSEYFLKGIQTLLRPKGFGEPIISGQPETLPDEPSPEEGEVSCNQNAPEANVAGLIDKDAFAALADRWSGSGNFASECFNDVVARAKSRGVNPAYALMVWLIESGASNYSISVEDFGVHLADVRGFSAQMDRFLGTVTGGAHNYCAVSGRPPWPSKLFGHIACYVTGEYDQTRPDYVRLKQNVEAYYATFTSLWSNIAGGCSIPTGPTDNSCP